ncbi:hypothetical protein [Microbulbifer sp. 2205BS26-8]|uniref:hypothetical protein n=1 Tax=Microbulbifer sp. 2205BS26-8 TaxID=3064386 RepID=UPI00273E505A|nr:hypothetical protein [Microbulbifer sp. 2205BS26-8]MDP5209202.1 hypothetical protein [Microbulbifer sp. 2205BS26-8]
MSNSGFLSEVIDNNDLEWYLTIEEDRGLAYDSKVFIDKFESRVSDLFSKSKLKYVSVDVFDTILFRNGKSEIRRFYEIADLISSSEICVNKKITTLDIFMARIDSTKVTYRASNTIDGCREGSLIDIYQQICFILGIEQKYIDEFIDIEIRYEIDNLKANFGLWEILKNYKNNGVKIVFLSDMYMHGKHIKKILNHFFFDFDNVVIKVVSSADEVISKHSGKIYKKLKSDFKWPSKNWLHLGDNHHSDVVQAKRNGINSIHLPINNQTLIEQEECRNRFYTFFKSKSISNGYLI